MSLIRGFAGSPQITQIARINLFNLRYLWILLVFWPLVAWGAAKLLIVNSPIDNPEAIAVLSGSGAYKERTSEAAELFKAGKAQRIILTNDNQLGGWSTVEERNPFYYELERAELQKAGISRERITVLIEPVTGTYEEAVLLRQYTEAQGIKSLQVVTSAYHSRRAWWTFRRVFQGSSTAVGLQSANTGWQSPRPATWWLHLRGWRAVPLEYIKMVYYWFRLP